MAAEDLEFRVQGSTELGKGAGVALSQAQRVAQMADEVPQAKVQSEEGQPTDLLTADLENPYSDTNAPDYTDALDEEFLGPTNFPQRPVTNGMAFGPGADFVARPDESDSQFMQRVAENMLRGGRQVPDDAKVWALRALAGM